MSKNIRRIWVISGIPRKTIYCYILMFFVIALLWFYPHLFTNSSCYIVSIVKPDDKVLQEINTDSSAFDTSLTIRGKHFSSTEENLGELVRSVADRESADTKQKQNNYDEFVPVILKNKNTFYTTPTDSSAFDTSLTIRAEHFSSTGENFGELARSIADRESADTKQKQNNYDEFVPVILKNKNTFYTTPSLGDENNIKQTSKGQSPSSIDLQGNHQHLAEDSSPTTEKIGTSTVPQTMYSSQMKSENTSNQLKKSSLVLNPITSQHDASTHASDINRKYLVYSKNCKIPNIDPYHSSIQHLISYSKPFKCADQLPLTRTEDNVLILDSYALQQRSLRNISCCYTPLFRHEEGLSDNKYRFGRKCFKFRNRVQIKDEFLFVRCFNALKEDVYQEFHSFIIEKPHVEKRCNKLRSISPRFSVLIVGIDAMSRMNMHRQLNGTLDYLTKEMGAVEMLGFNKVGDNTFPNLVPLLLGYDERELPGVCWNPEDDAPLDGCDFVWKRFARKGYRTLYAEDTPAMSTFNYMKEGFYYQPTDYYFRPFIKAYEKILGHSRKMNCVRCVGSVTEVEATLHWTQRFVDRFRSRPSFSLSWTNSMTHDLLNSGSAADAVYETFFRTLHRSGALNTTIVVVVGDHGMRWGPIRATYVGRLEERLPILLVSLPEAFKEIFPLEVAALDANSRRLVTPFDLHATLMHVLHIGHDWVLTNRDKVSEGLVRNFTRRAHSLLRHVPQDRSCADAFIDEHWCTCDASISVPSDADGVKNIVRFLISEINGLLLPLHRQCATLELSMIQDASVLSDPTEDGVDDSEDSDENVPKRDIYTVVFETVPGKGIFEGTVQILAEDHFERLGAVSRLNLYGNQSYCIKDAVLKKYCYCLK